MHERISAEDMIERYVRRELDGEDRHAFEEHLLECSECFEETQTTERFLAGIHDASRRGSLDPSPSRWTIWFGAAAALASCALIVTGVRISSLRRDLEESRQAQAALTANLQRPPDAPRAAILPLAVLQATRAAQNETVLRVPASAPQIALWIEVESGARYRTFRVEVATPQGEPVEAISGLRRNQDGALAVALPAAKLKLGLYRVTLYAEEPQRLLARYALRITAE